jgi:hypothetical protein
MSTPKFAEQQRVILKADADNGFVEQRGEVLCAPETEPDGHPMYIIGLDDEYFEQDDDDGIREVSEDQLEAEA